MTGLKQVPTCAAMFCSPETGPNQMLVLWDVDLNPRKSNYALIRATVSGAWQIAAAMSSAISFGLRPPPSNEVGLCNNQFALTTRTLSL